MHRIGRTGRAGKGGKAISYYSWPKNQKITKNLIKHLAKTGRKKNFFFSFKKKNFSSRSSGIFNE